jgi:phytoene dehydrogenase-like protein
MTTGADAVDAVVVGSGPNGLVAANVLVDAGWDVLVVETQERAGGAVASDTDVHPGFVHDTFSSFYPLAAASPTIRALALEEHGLSWTHAPAVAGTPFRDGRWALLHRDRHDTAAALDADSPGDGDAWLALCDAWDRVGEEVLAGVLGPFPPVRPVPGLLRGLPGPGGGRLLAGLLGSAERIQRGFSGRAARMLLAGNAAHADVPLDGLGSGAFAVLLTMMGQQLGFPVPVGGAGMLAQALQRRLEVRGGRIRLGTRVDRILVRGGRATGVRTDGGEEIAARRAVLADVSAPALYGDLVPAEHLPARTRLFLRRFTWDPGTVKVDWALDGPVPWRAAPERPPATVHVAESVEEITTAATQLADGMVPARPFLLVGQMAVADPSRAPDGGEALWAYTHVPQRVRGDAGADGIRGTWDVDDRERMADRIQARLAAYAPDLESRIVARRVLGPRELEQRDANLVNGALNGGTARLRQQLVLRPTPGLAGTRTPVARLLLASASAHPGGGVHGACGANAARAALRDDHR